MNIEKLKEKLELELNLCLARAKILSEKETPYEEIAHLIEKALLKLKLLNKNPLY